MGYRTFGITIGIERLRQIKPCLMVLRIGLDLFGQFCNGACISGLPRKDELCMGRFQLWRLGNLNRRTVQQCLGLVQITHRNMGTHQPAVSSGMFIVLVQNGGKGLGRIRCRAFGQHFIRSLDGIGQRIAGCFATACLDHLVNERQNLGLRQRALKTINRLAFIEGIDRRNRLDLKLRRDLLRRFPSLELHEDAATLGATLAAGGLDGADCGGIAWAVLDLSRFCRIHFNFHPFLGCAKREALQQPVCPVPKP